ncbi:MAG: TolC family protein [Verrucomicrobiae bacterium]|nr:TolC family protein [Verrucomicrobiae bacterium]
MVLYCARNTLRTDTLKPNESISRWSRGGRAAGMASLMALAALPCGCLTTDQGAAKLDPALTGQIPATWTAARIKVPDPAATGWLDDFNGDRLKKLVLASVDQNYDLAAAAARVRQAHARLRIAGADQWPQFDTDLNIARSQNLRGAAFQTVRANTFNLGLNLSWEVDLWGRIANLRRAAAAEFDASTADYRAARLSLAANTTKTTLELVESRLQIILSRENLESLETNLKILDRKLEAGDADDRTALEISLSRADIARAKATIAQQQREADASRRLLETLMGDYPEGTLDGLDDLPTVQREIPVGLPSDLLLRRPDLVAAELRVDARLEEIAAARKALLPAFRITGGAGTSTTQEFTDLFNIQNLVWNIGGGLTQPIFEGGRLIAEIDLSEAERDEIAADYADAALNAFREVETALAAERFYRDQQAALEIAVEEAKRAEELSLSQYENGLVDIITLLESQRRSFDAQSALISVRRQRLASRIDLYLALGGDFDSSPVIEAAPDSGSIKRGGNASRKSPAVSRPGRR